MKASTLISKLQILIRIRKNQSLILKIRIQPDPNLILKLRFGRIRKVGFIRILDLVGH